MAYFGPEIDSLETPVMSREDLVGRILEGPVIIEEYDATCAIPPGYTVTIDDAANIDIQLKKRKYVT
jgi:N-methylhydantoinase A